MLNKDTDVITIRKTVTITVKIEKATEKSTTTPIIVVVLDAEAPNN